jgi:KipI family sensor histidine kinase inhibitor
VIDRSAGLVVRPFGDEAVLITLGEAIDPGLSERVRRLVDALEADLRRSIPIGRPVAGYASLLVPYDAAALGVADALREIGAFARRVDERPVLLAEEEARPLVEVPTRYGGVDGVDLDLVAEASGRSAAEVLELHASREYRVFMLGFVPGFAYLGIVPEEIAVPRRATPRARVPAGSVAIAERQTAVYPVETPGGWNLIGRTDLRVWDARRERPALLEVGTRVRFVPTTAP